MTTPPGRRWFQFSLGTMLLLILAAALAVYGFNERQKRLREEERLREAQALIGNHESDIARFQNAMDESRRTIEQLLKRISPDAAPAPESFSPQTKLPQPAPQP